MKNLILAISILVSGVATAQHWSERYGKFYDENPNKRGTTYMVHCSSTFENENACAYNVTYKGLDTMSVLDDFFEKCTELCLDAGVNLHFKDFDVSYAFDFNLLGDELIEIYDGADALSLNDMETDVVAIYVDMDDTDIRISFFYEK